MDKDTIFNLCQSILQNTDDGNTLAGRDLHLVESAANGFLTPRGGVALYQLDHSIKDGSYELPVFCGVGGLTRGTNGDRSVYWKGKKVEHYDHDFWCEDGWQEDMKRDAQKLGKVCQAMEDQKVEINFNNYCTFQQDRS
jgi:hypothetical protein